jgi:acetyl-CoA carboxylase carboxyl transferase subunit alpha
MSKTPFEIVEASREDRFYADELVNRVFTNFVAFHGDRAQGDDPAVIGGIGLLNDQPVTVIAIDRGHDIADKLMKRNGSPEASGYRKAIRLMEQADKFNRPIVTFINTPGAFPGKTAEEGGVGQSIAESILKSMSFTVPMIAIIYGEGGSGGALALATANEVWMFEHSIYSVLSPEGFAAIMWKDAKRAPEAAELLGITPSVLLERRVIDKIIAEPADKTLVFQDLRTQLSETITRMQALPSHQLAAQRQRRFADF